MKSGANKHIKGDYPPDWPEISKQVKEKAGNRCERCKHPDDRIAGYMLTTHHLDGDKSNVEDWNLAALCQRCHLSIQSRVDMFQAYFFDHTPWMKPHVEGRDKALAMGVWP